MGMPEKQMVPGLRQPQPVREKAAVIARLPDHAKKLLMMLAVSNSLIFISFGMDWLGVEKGMSPTMIALSAMAAFWSVICIPIFMWFITNTDWGQRGG
jgi:hypothetical protein